MTGSTNVGASGPSLKSIKLSFKKGTNYSKPYQTSKIDAAHYNSYPSFSSSERDNIQIDVGQITRYFCNEIPYEGQVLGYKINGVYYPLFYMKPKGFSVILRDIFSASIIHLIHTFHNQEIAFMLDSEKNKVYVGARSYEGRTDWTPDKDYNVEIFYMKNP